MNFCSYRKKDVIEKAERVVKDILEKKKRKEKKHANATKKTLRLTPSLKSPAQATNPPAHSRSLNSDHSGNCNQRFKPSKIPASNGV